MSHPDPPVSQFNTLPPKLSEVRKVVRKARAASASDPNRIPYKLYKNCPTVLKLLLTLMQVAWKKHCIPVEWQRAMAVYIP